VGCGATRLASLGSLGDPTSPGGLLRVRRCFFGTGRKSRHFILLRGGVDRRRWWNDNRQLASWLFFYSEPMLSAGETHRPSLASQVI